GSKYQECSRCHTRNTEIIPAYGASGTVQDVADVIQKIEIPSEGEMPEEDRTAVSNAIDSLVTIDNEELLAVENAVDTIVKLDELAVAGLESVSETRYAVDDELKAQIGEPEVKGAALTAAAVSKDETPGENETLSVKVNMDVSENSYEELPGKTVAIDITMSVVKVNADGEETETVQTNIQPSTPIQVTIKIPDDFEGKEFELYHVSG